MIATGSYNCEQLEATPRIAGRVGEHFQEGRPAHVVGARAGEQHPTRGQGAHRAEVDLLITGECPGDALLRFGEGGWVEHHRVERFFPALELAQQVERVGLTPRDVREAVQRGVVAPPSQSVGA